MHCKEYEQNQGEATLVVQWFAVPRIKTRIMRSSAFWLSDFNLYKSLCCDE